MLKNIWSIMCEHILTEAGTNRHSYIQIIESGNLSSFPASLPSFSIATYWEKSSEEEVTIGLRVSFKHPTGETEKVIETEHFEFKRRTQHIDLKNLPGFVAKAPGRHAILIEHSEGHHDWQLSSELPIYIQEKEKSKKNE